MRALLLGATGFVGRWVATKLTQRGARLVCTTRSSTAVASVSDWPIQAEWVELDLSQPGALARTVADVAPEVVFNLAGYGVDRQERDPDLARRINAEVPAELCAAVAEVPAPGRTGARVVHVGSALEYGEIGGDLAEDSETNATTLYGRTKLAGTRALAERAAELGVASVTARLFTVYGAGEHPGRLLPALLDAARGDGPLPLTAGLQQRDFTWVGDVADGLVRLAQTPSLAAWGPGPVVNLATGILTPVRAFVETAAGVLGIEPERLRFGELPTRAEEMAHEPVSIERLRTALGWRPPTSIEAGVARTRDFARQAGAPPPRP